MSAIPKVRSIGSGIVELFDYDGVRYPGYLKTGNAMQFIEPIAKQFCRGIGLDVGCGKWPLPGARPIDRLRGDDVMSLPEGLWDYVFSSHMLEHLADPVSALEHWKTRLRAGGVLFLYLPSTQMRYWNTTRNRRHLHEWEPAQMARILRDLGFVDVLHSERDMAWSFCCLGFNGASS